MEAKQVADMMEAYASVYSQKPEQEVVNEGLGAKAAELVDRGTKAIQSGLEKAGVPINRQKRGTVTKAEQEDKIKGNVKEETDLFDVILEHLIAEGYADTNQAALAIMANMSEEWKQSIVEGDALRNTIKTLEGKRDAMNANKPGSANTADPGKQSVGAATYKAYQRLRGV